MEYEYFYIGSIEFKVQKETLSDNGHLLWYSDTYLDDIFLNEIDTCKGFRTKEKAIEYVTKGVQKVAKKLLES